MADDKGFAYAFGWNVFYQKILGVPTVTGTEQRIWFWVFVMTFSTLLPQAASLPILWGDLNSVINCLSTNVSVIVAVTKIATLQYKRRVISRIFVKIVKDWLSVGTKMELEIMLETAQISRIVSIVSVYISNILFIGYVTLQVSTILLQGRDPNKDPRLAFGFLVDAYFPFDTSNPFVFVLLWIGQFIGTSLSVVAYSGLDCFVAMAVLHLCGQLKIIRHFLKHLINKETTENRKKYWQTLGTIVERHENVNELAIVIKETFSPILLVQVVACSLIICFEGYTMLMTVLSEKSSSISVLDMITRVVFTIYTVTHLFIYCYVGERLLNESTGIADDFYDTEWYNIAPEEAKAFLFVWHRSRIPNELKAGKFCTFNLDLFNNAMKSSMGYLSMLMALKDRVVD